MCVPAQINIWLTLQSGYYLAEISEREVGGLAAFFLFILLLPPFSIAARTQLSLAVTQPLTDTRQDRDRQLPGFLAKMRKSSALKSMR